MKERRWPIGFLLGMVALLSACGERPPSEPVADPRAQAIEWVQEAELRPWWSVYRDQDPKLIGEVVDAAAKLSPNGLPKDSHELERFVKHRVLTRYRQRMESSDEGKAFILARSRERFANPPSTVWDRKGRVALTDYHVLPGVWKSTSRVSEGLKDSPALGRAPFLKPEISSAALRRLATSYPKARVFQLHYGYHAGSSLERVLIQFSPGSCIVYRRGVMLAFTKEAVSWEDMTSGNLALESLTWLQPMNGTPTPNLRKPPHDLLPL